MIKRSTTVATATRSAEAKAHFVDAVKRRLSPRAIDDLFRVGFDEATDWAKELGIEAPCMIDEATKMLRLGRRGEDIDVEKYSPGPFDEWLDELQRIDALTPSKRLRIAYHDVRHVVAMTAADELLAPVAADPLRETRQQFLARAKEHFQLRRARLKQLAVSAGFIPTLPRSSPELMKHTNWLLDFQMDGKSFAQIAKQAHRGEETVRVAVKRLAGLMGLRLRRGRPGRPKRQK